MGLDFRYEDAVIIGYSGHAFVVIDAILSQKSTIRGYCEREEKSLNPYNLHYLGNDEEHLIANQNWFIGIGSNEIRRKLYHKYQSIGKLMTVTHSTSVIGLHCEIDEGTLLSANAVINPLSKIGKCCIINTGTIVEHECRVGDFSHIAPGAVLAGNVTVGNSVFIGANSVVKQGVHIGNQAIIGAGTVVLNDVPENTTVVGNPGRILKR